MQRSKIEALSGLLQQKLMIQRENVGAETNRKDIFCIEERKRESGKRKSTIKKKMIECKKKWKTCLLILTIGARSVNPYEKGLKSPTFSPYRLCSRQYNSPSESGRSG